MKIGKKLARSFYLKEDVKEVAKLLLGKVLVTQVNGQRTSGIITETEAYEGAIDKASHAYGNRRTLRTETMFESGGCAYVYLCYGIHNMFNVVTGPKDLAHAVLIRAIEPFEGIETMLKRRNKNKLSFDLTAGPGCLCQALGINRLINGENLLGNTVFILDTDVKLTNKQIIASPRVGVHYAQEHSQWPYRFRIKESSWTSRPK